MAGRSPGRPGPRAAGSRPTARIIRFEALIPWRSPRRRTPQVSLWERPCSPGFSPLQSLLHPPLGPSDPSQPRTATPDARQRASATSRTSRPPRRVGARETATRTARSHPSADTSPVRAGPRRLTAAFLLPRPWTPAGATPRSSWSTELRSERTAASPPVRKAPALLGFPTSSTTSLLRSRARPWLMCSPRR